MVILGGFFSSTLFHVIGALYPAYQTFKALNNTNNDNTNDDNYDETIEENNEQQGYSNNEKTENNNSSVTNAKNWLTYWCVYATLITLEYFLLFFNWLPFYYEFKILFLFWLIFNVNNEFGGSNFIYKQYILPFLESRELQIDLILEEISEIFIPIKNFIKELPKEEVYKLKRQALMNEDETKEEEEAMAEEEEVIVINKANKENDINKEEENVVEIEEGHEEDDDDERLVVEVKINNNESENKDSNNKKKKNAFKRFGERVVKILNEKKKKQHERSLSLLDIIHQ
ncbi:hypothetical protein ABK040_009936 [Willaertia magna]